MDSLGVVTITDTIFKNTIWKREVKSDILFPTKLITKEIYLNNREFYWGVGASGRSDQINYIGGEILYKDKKKQIYGLGLGVNQDFKPVISGKLYWKIGKK